MEKPPFHNSYILWIEDEPEEYDPLLQDIQNLVDPRHVINVRTEDEANILLKNQSFDLILLDLLIPKTDRDFKNGLVSLDSGYRLLYVLRQNEEWATNRDCNVIVVTARCSREALMKVQDLLGSHDSLIEKPTTIEYIIQVICSTLGGRE